MKLICGAFTKEIGQEKLQCTCVDGATRDTSVSDGSACKCSYNFEVDENKENACRRISNNGGDDTNGGNDDGDEEEHCSDTERFFGLCAASPIYTILFALVILIIF